MAIYKTTYKLKNASDTYDTYYFYTSAALVSETTDRKWLSATEKTKLDAIAMTLNGSATNTPTWYAVTTVGTKGAIEVSNGSGAPVWLSQGTSGQVLKSGGSGALPSWVAQSSLSVGSATNATNATNVALTATTSTTESSIKGNTIQLQAGSGTAASFTIDNVANADFAYSSKFANYLGDETDGTFTYTEIKEALSNVNAVAAGKTGAYAISVSGANNSFFNSHEDELTTTTTSMTVITTFNSSISTSTTNTINFADLKVGDVIYIVETGVPDRWFAGWTGSEFLFYKMETTKIDLTDYVKSGATVSNSDSGTLTHNSSYVVTGLSITSGGKVTLTRSKLPADNNTTYTLTSTSAGQLTFKPSSGTTQTVSINGWKSTDTTPTESSDNWITSGGVYEYVKDTIAKSHKVVASATSPSNMSTGDIWLDISGGTLS